jgi:central kinetochore subunit Mal2/MCM21
MSHHLRLSAITSLRVSLGLNDKPARGKQPTSHNIKTLEMTDVEGRDVRILWTDGRVGRVRVGIGGMVEKCVVIGEGGRERAVERVVMGGDRRIEGLGERLKRT